MSAHDVLPDQRLGWSLSIYRALLALYPAPFRRAFGRQMEQVFAAQCREVFRREGAVALARLWWWTLGDLLATAFAERMEQPMSPTTRYRLAGRVSLIGIGVWLLGAAGLALYSIINPAYSPNIEIATSFAWVFFIVGLVGLYERLAEHSSKLVWLPGAIAIATVTLIMVSGAYHGYISGVGVQYSANKTVVELSARSQIDEQLSQLAYEAENLSYPALGLALVATGLVITRVHELRRIAKTVIVMGVVTALYYFFTDMGAPSILRNTGAPGMIGLILGFIVFFVTWLGGWARLGLWLAREGAKSQSSGASTESTVGLEPA